MAKLTRKEIISKLKPIKLVILDVDGVLTNDSIYIGPGGREYKQFHVSDGLAIRLVAKLGIETAVISGRYAEATEVRMAELKVPHRYYDIGKMACFDDLLKKTGFKTSQTVFMGNDILDIDVMKKAALGICPSNAEPEVVRIADYRTKRAGGQGAVRDLYELIALAHGKKLVDLL